MPTEDRLVDVTEAAKMLATSEDFLYRHWPELPFTVWLSKRQLRFSVAGIARYIAAKAGKTPEEETLHAGPRV
jgi:hypothetical protein